VRPVGKTSELKNRCEIGELDSNSTDHCQSAGGLEAALSLGVLFASARLSEIIGRADTIAPFALGAIHRLVRRIE
jgi:hypothetical protein